MMDLVRRLAERAQSIDTQMGELATRESAAETKRQALAELRDQIDRMTSDGWLDPGELAELDAALAANGVDPSALSARGRTAHGVGADRELIEDLRDAIGTAQRKLGKGAFEYEAQELVAEFRAAFDGASTISKAEHDVYMTAIRNMAC